MLDKRYNTLCFCQKQVIACVKKISLVFFFFCLASIAFSQDLAELSAQKIDDVFIEDFFSDEIIQELKTTGKIQRNFYGKKDIQLELWPNTELGRQAANYWQREDEPVFLVESLYLLKKSDIQSTENDIDRISVILRSLSQMTGMEYYSTSRKIYEVLYTDVYTVNNLKDQIQIDDRTMGTADGMVSYVYQKDRSLSGCVYEFSYFQNENEVSFRAFNAEKITYKGFKIVNPENLVLTLVATDVGDSIAFYILVQADVPRIPFVSARLARSFSSRADAIYNWCVDMYKESL